MQNHSFYLYFNAGFQHRFSIFYKNMLRSINTLKSKKFLTLFVNLSTLFSASYIHDCLYLYCKKSQTFN